MTERPSARDRLRAIGAKLNVPIDDIIGDFLSPEAAAETPPQPALSKAIRLTDAAIRAAINDSFSATEIGAGADDDALLRESHLVMIGGRRRLRLDDSARAAILREAVSTPRYKELLGTALETDRAVPQAALNETTTRSMCMRRILTDSIDDLTKVTVPELRATVAALERLRAAPVSPRVPPLAEAQRLLEYAELLEPLRITIGATGPWNEPPEADRFAGRRDLLRQLRVFVDEIEAESALESLERGVAGGVGTIRRAFGDKRIAGVRFIAALGGLGKSALIAKFVLDHALKQTRRFPFAYLDFDRAAIQTRDPRQILLEVSRQVALQFPEIAQELGELRERIRRSLNTTFTPTDEDPFLAFRSIVRRVTRGERAMLIVFDTIEVVQADRPSMSGLLAFLERMAKDSFTELRIVAAGRAQAGDLLAETSTRHQGVLLRLEPLLPDEALTMVERLGRALMPSAWKDHWTPRLAGSPAEPPQRREPLTLRVAVETLRDAKPEHREVKSSEIERLGEGADESFVGKLYEHRVVGHVGGGEDVRTIAWPGLVVRRVSVTTIRELLAPALGVDPSRAESIFEALANQLWIVVRDGDGLKHQQDLRARTLPLMRRRPQFDEINTAAIKYFGDRRTRSLRDHAEWMYHRLLGGENPESVDRDWVDSLAPLLKNALNDFPRDSAAAAYLAARTSDGLLADDEIARLGPSLAMQHIVRTGLHKTGLADRALDPLLITLRLDSIDPTRLAGAAGAARVALLVKTGRWREDYGYDVSHDFGDDRSWNQQAATALAFRRTRMRLGAGSVTDELERDYRSSRATERAALATLIQDLAASRMARSKLATMLDAAVARQLERGVSTIDWTVGLPTLRTAMIFGDRAVAPAARAWLTQMTERVRAGDDVAFSARERGALDPDASNGDAGERKRLHDPALAERLLGLFRARCEAGQPDDVRVLRRFAAARDEDWLVPMGYAAHRANGGRVPKEMRELYRSHDPASYSFIQRAIQRDPAVPGDIVEVLARADEASDLGAAARLFAEQGDAENSRDLHVLLQSHGNWRAAVEDVVESADDRLA